MTEPAPSERSSPLRVGGFVLLGLGLIAALVGLFTLFGGNGGDGDGNTAAPPPTTAETGPPAPGTEPTPGGPPPGGSAAPPSDGTVPLPSFGPGSTPGIAAPPPGSAPGGAPPGGGSGSGGAGGAGAGGAGAGAGGGTGGGLAGGGGGGLTIAHAPVRVYNNSTISGLAARAADNFRNAGWTVEDVANYPSGIIPTSTVYYRAGTSEQAAAQSLGSQFGLRVEPRFSGLDEASPGLIVIVTNDYTAR